MYLVDSRNIIVECAKLTFFAPPLKEVPRSLQTEASQPSLKFGKKNNCRFTYKWFYWTGITFQKLFLERQNHWETSPSIYFCIPLIVFLPS